MTDAVIFQNQPFYFYGSMSSYRHCFEVTALNNSEINPPVSTTLEISAKVLGRMPVHIKTIPGLLVINDNDGELNTYKRVSSIIVNATMSKKQIRVSE